MNRRDWFLLLAVSCLSMLRPTGSWSADGAADIRTIQHVIDLLLAEAPRPPAPLTVDTIKTGDPTRPIKGVVTTFMASVAVIEEAIAAGANLIITHEPTFYNHRDDTDWLAADPIYRAKRKLLDDHGIVTFRYHDVIHAITPDPVLQATVDQLGWSKAAVADAPQVYELPPRPLAALVAEVKARLDAPQVRVVGDFAQVCSRVGLLVGASGGRRHISFLSAHAVDVLIVGEIAEWETSEYVRDANRVGRPLALIVVGHSVSESLGMEWLAVWLRPKLREVPVHYVAAPAPFAYP